MWNKKIYWVSSKVEHPNEDFVKWAKNPYTQHLIRMINSFNGETIDNCHYPFIYLGFQWGENHNEGIIHFQVNADKEFTGPSKLHYKRCIIDLMECGTKPVEQSSDSITEQK